jgi:WD40 repeat protein
MKGDVFLRSVGQPTKPVERLGPHRGPIKTIAFAPSRPIRLATAGGDGLVHVWTQPSNIRTAAHIEVGPNVYAVAFSPDGSTLAIGDTGRVRLLPSGDAGPGISPALLDMPGVASLAFSSDGRLLATGGVDRSARVWDLANRRELQRINAAVAVTSVAFSPDNKYLGMGSAGGATWAPVKPKDHIQTFSASEVRALACSQAPAGAQLSQEEWTRYFGQTEPVRYTCRPPPSPLPKS